MWIIQICIASFWWYIAVHLLFREAKVWRTVEHIAWFSKNFSNCASLRWERFCRDAGVLALVTGCLLFVKLPFGVGALGIIIALPPIIFLF